MLLSLHQRIGLLLCAMVLLCGVAYATAGASLAKAASSIIHEVTAAIHGLLRQSHGLTMASTALISPALRPALHDIVSGATSVLRLFSGVDATAAGFGDAPRALTEPSMTVWRAVATHTTSKLFYSMGLMGAQLGLLHMFYTEPFRNARHNRVNKFFSSIGGGFLLVLLVSFPNGVVELAVVITFVAKLSAPVYTWSIIVGGFARPYLAAALLAWVSVPKSGDSAVRSALHRLSVKPSATADESRWMELAMWLCLIGAFVLLAVQHAHRLLRRVLGRSTPMEMVEEED